MQKTLKAFWQDCDDIVEWPDARPLTLEEALNTWAQSRGAERNFFGLIDDSERTIQLYFIASIPDHIEDARFLPIVGVDFPVPSRAGSFSGVITIGEAPKWLERAFQFGADPEKFEGLEFSRWE